MSKKVRCTVWFIYCCILGVQIASVFSSGYYIIPLTLSNVAEYSALGFNVVVKLILIVVLFSLSSLLIFLVRTKNKFVPLMFFSAIFSFVVIFLFPTPLVTLCKTLFSYYEQITYTPNYNYPAMSKKYLKVGIWGEGASQSPLNFEKQNVIVIFTEGMSSNIIDEVNHRNLNLTPNIDALYKNSIVFENYFNHTAATFRGLRGQLTSAYQFKDGVNEQNDGFAQITNETVVSSYQNRLVSLPEILVKHGYKTYFLASTEKNSTLNTMLKGMSFTNVYGMGDFPFYQDDRMTDKQTFLALKQLLSSQREQPFFIGVYPSGTHHGRDSPDLKYGNGLNTYYNKFYNYDAQLGEFIKFFDKSEYSSNTVLILTADHSTFPTPEFRNSFAANSKYFVDQIPLIIHKVGMQSKVIDAQGRNSLSLAPTILQLIGVNNEPNYFLGCSLFDLLCKSKFSNISAVGDSYLETHSGVYPEYNVFEIEKEPNIVDSYNISG